MNQCVTGGTDGDLVFQLGLPTPRSELDVVTVVRSVAAARIATVSCLPGENLASQLAREADALVDRLDRESRELHAQETLLRESMQQAEADALANRMHELEAREITAEIRELQLRLSELTARLEQLQVQ